MAGSSSQSLAKMRSPQSPLIDQAVIDRAHALLQDLPEKPKESWTLKEAIAALDGSIFQALERGYSYEEVAALLSEQGIQISVSSLKRYLATSRKEKGMSSRRPHNRTGTVTSPPNNDLQLESAVSPENSQQKQQKQRKSGQTTARTQTNRMKRSPRSSKKAASE